MTLRDAIDPSLSALHGPPARCFARTMKTIDLVCFDGGAGHRAALALQSVIREQRRPWLVRLVDPSGWLDHESTGNSLCRTASTGAMRMRCVHGWKPTNARAVRLLRRVAELAHSALVASLRQHWLAGEPDLVVSLVPFFNRALCESVTGTLPGVPFATVLTDLADAPPHYWIEPGQPQHLVCGSATALAQARASGYDDSSLSLTSGMVLAPDFYRPSLTDRRRDRRALGLDPDRVTGIVRFGIDGSAQVARIVNELRDVQLILMCGHDEALALKLRSLCRRAPHTVVGYTPELSRYLKLGDFYIGRPGSTSLSEAVRCDLPTITFESALALPQHRYNAQWVRDNGLGLVLRSTRSSRAAVAEMIERLPEFRRSVRRIDNRAAFEVPEILADLLNAAALPKPSLRWQFAASNAT